MEETVDKLGGSALKLYNSIEKIIVKKGVLAKDPKIWEFHISGKVIKIDAQNVEDYGFFRKQYIQMFDEPATYLKKDDWLDLFNALSENKKEIDDNEEESEDVCIARQLLEVIQKIPVSEDKEDAFNNKCLLKTQKEGQDVLFISSEKINELIKEHDFKKSSNVLSPVMTELGFKIAGTDNPRLGGRKVRGWYFYTKVIIETAGEDTDTTGETELV